jgi:hypothetical protein
MNTYNRRIHLFLGVMQDVEELGLLSLKTAKKLFAIKITLILTYGVEHILVHFTEGDLIIFESMKAEYLKRQFLYHDSHTPWPGNCS